MGRRATLALFAGLAVSPLACAKILGVEGVEPGAPLPDGATPDHAVDDGNALADALPTDALQVDGADGGLFEAGSVTEVAPRGPRPAAFVAVDSQNIYWWSDQDGGVIAKASKTNPPIVGTAALRPSQTVNAIAAAADGLYWLEHGPDGDGGAVNDRIMVLDSATQPRAVFRSADPLRGLAIDPDRIVTAVVGGTSGVEFVPKGDGGARLVGGAIDPKGLASDDITVFYTSGDGVYRAQRTTTTPMLFLGIGGSGPRELALDQAYLYGVFDLDGGSAIVKIDHAPAQATDNDVVRLAPAAGHTTFMALGPSGVAWVSVSDGKVEQVSKLGGDASTIASVLLPNSIAVDEDGVYWTTDEGIVGWAHP